MPGRVRSGWSSCRPERADLDCYRIDADWAPLEEFTGPFELRLGGFSLGGERMTRTAFLVGGFNLHHSLKDASFHLGLRGAGTRWLDPRSFSSSFLHIVGGGAQISRIYYFSALAKNWEATRPDVTARHLA